METVISDEARKKKWIPPEGRSCLPRAIREQIPKELRYWLEKDQEKRIEIRDKLIDYLKEKGELKEARSIRFRLLHHFWKGQTVVRAGPSKSHYDLVWDDGKRTNMFRLEYDPRGLKPSAALLNEEDPDRLWKVSSESDIVTIPPKTLLNPTKETKCWIEVLDAGRGTLLIDDEDLKKFEFKGKTLKGIFLATRPPGEDIWEFKRVKGAPG